ncbi:MAG: hypothetical protein WBQ23_07200 [Bacteroidota bacterium]
MNMLTKKNSAAVNTSASENSTSRSFRTRIPGYSIRLLALIGIALLVWKVIAVSVLESEQEDALQALRDSTELRITQRTLLLGQAAGVSVGQSIGVALRAGDIESARRLCDVLVQGSSVSDYIITNEKGMILAALHPEMVGEPLETNLQRVASSLDKPLVDTIETGLTRVIVPMRDDRGKLGTAILTFRLP